MVFLSLFIAILPVALILFLFYTKVSSGKKEPLLYLSFAFLTGVCVAFLSFFLEKVLDELIYENILDGVAPFVQSFFAVSLIEEGFKWLPLFFIFRKWTKWNEYSDAVMYTICIGMGFAIVENIIYGMDGDVWVSVLRAFTAVPAHAVFAVLMGFFLSRFHFEHQKVFLFMSLFLPFFLHGLYDFFIIQNYAEWLMILALVVLIICLFLSVHLIKQTRIVDDAK